MTKEFLSSLSPQTLLRQLSCGVIFLLPIALFSPQVFAYGAFSGDKSAEVITLCGFVAYVFGTIIYHLEKNLYSYGVQFLFSLVPYHNRARRKWVTVLYIIPFLAMWAVIYENLSPFFLCITMIWPSIISGIFILIASVIKKEKYTFLTEVRRIWTFERLMQNESQCSNVNGAVSISAVCEKLAHWSDFIHCGQSCAFAWLLGAFVANCFTPHACFGRDCSCYICPAGPELYSWSIYIAVLLLLFELLIDWHRYQHVMFLLSLDSKSEGK